MNATREEFLLQWNTSSLISHWAEFREYITSKKPLIAAIQETHFLDTDLDKYRLTPFGYSLYCDNVNTKPRRGGSALYVSNNLLHHQVFFDSPLNYVAISVKFAQREIIVISIYLSPNVTFRQQLDELFQQIPSPCLILGDFNAHHLAWGCHTTNTRGNQLHSLLDQHNLAYLNDTTPTYQCYRAGQASSSVIDLSLASPQIATLFTSQVQNDRYFSDHYPIHLILEIPSGQTNFNFLPRWNFKRADWISFQEYIDIKHPLQSEPNLSEFLNTILASAHANIPHTCPPQGRKHAPWWNNDCQKAVALRRRALRAFQRCICENHEKAAREACDQAKSTILNAKKESWEDFWSTFNRFTPLSKIWSTLKCFSNKRPPAYKIPHLHIHNQHYSTPLEVATQFAAHYARISSHSSYTTDTHNTLNTTLATCHFHSDNTEPYNHLYTPYELRLALSKSGNTSVGPDQLAYPFFQNLTECGLQNFLFALNKLWEDGTFPDSWSSSTLIPILKPRKPPADPASYRPISLSSCASKILERMVNGRIRTYLEANKLLSPYQNGFRPGHSTADSLVHLIDSVQRGFHKDHVTVALFLDLKAAFDKVHHSALIIKLHKIGVRGRLATYLRNFINNRTFSVRCGNTYSERLAQEQGIPQGSPLSPTLFLILINDIFNDLTDISLHFQYSMYADDLAVWFSHPNVDQANRLIQLALNKIQDWCYRWGVQISPAKSATLVFSHRLTVQPATPLNLNGEIIPLVDHFKYLGLTLDRRLTFNVHVADIKQRCSRRLNILKCISGREWGADRRTLLRLYTSLIRPILDYNAFLFGNISSTLVDRIETIQNAALRIATGAFRTTPISNLLVDTNIPPLIRRREYQLLRFFVRASSRPAELTYNIMSHFPTYRIPTHCQYKFSTIATRVEKVFADYKLHIPRISPAPPLRPYWTEDPLDTHILFSNPKAHMNPEEIKATFYQFQETYNDYTYFYTDGSRADGHTGAAFVTGSFVSQYRLSDSHSVYSAELTAILYAIIYIKNNRIGKAVICTDSRSAIFALTSQHNSSHPYVYHIYRKAHRTNSDIKFLWIPGHSGIPGNTRADLAAKESLNKPIRNGIPCPVADYFNIIRSHFQTSIQEDWERNPHFHLYPIKPILQHWHSSNQDNRLKEILLARLRTGHTNLTHVYLFGRTPPPICHRCNCRYSIQHFLLDCPLYAEHRRPLLRHAEGQRQPLTLPLLLGDSDSVLLDLLFEFLHKTRLELSI